MDNLLQKLCIETGLRESIAHRIISTAPIRYKDFTIPKRNGGEREISQPSREVKLLQRALMTIVLEKIPVHEAATAYIKGSSTLSNALPHAGHGPILKLDFKDFFPSIRSDDWRNFCRTNSIFSNDDDINLSTNLLFRRKKGDRIGRLAIGAPSSPMLSNIMMYEFDRIVSEMVSKDHVIYTRYADDMTFSSRRTGFLVNVKNIVEEAISRIGSPKLALNKEKTLYVTPKFGRIVTGLTLGNNGTVGIGKKKKRIIHASVHGALHGKLDFKEMRALAGTLAYVNSVEPEFVHVLARRYGADIIRQIQKTVVIRAAGKRIAGFKSAD